MNRATLRLLATDLKQAIDNALLSTRHSGGTDMAPGSNYPNSWPAIFTPPEPPAPLPETPFSTGGKPAQPPPDPGTMPQRGEEFP